LTLRGGGAKYTVDRSTASSREALMTVPTAVVRRLPPTLAAVGVAFTLACAGHRTKPDWLAPPGTRFITAEQIQASGAKTAWEALRLTVPLYKFRDANRGTPGRIDSRGRSSVLLADQPRVLLDGTDLTEFGVLGQMPATDLESIEVLSGIEATTRYGTNATKGVIILRTKS
jgi:outer membrane receptor protein involved in Fe transport